MGKKQVTSKTKKKRRVAERNGHLQAAARYIESWCGAAELAAVDFHSHSTCSDGLLSPEQLVHRAFKQGVKVLALTDHDTMAGVPAAIAAAQKLGVRVVPGVEISTRYTTSSGELGEGVHIIALYGSCGPAQGLQEKLARIREGRFDRARSMIDKLNELKKPIKWESVVEIAGAGVAPGRPHIARALLQAGHVKSTQEAFSKLIGDNGPAYSTGFELPAAEAVELITKTGGVSVLAHPWSLKNPLDVIKQLKEAGLHAMEVYKASGKDKGFGALAEAYQLVKVGGSDFHGTGGADETEVGKVQIPVLALQQLLRTAEPLWSSSLKQIISDFADGKLESLFGDAQLFLTPEKASLRLSSWLSDEEKQLASEFALSLGLGVDFQDSGGMIICKTIN